MTFATFLKVKHFDMLKFSVQTRIHILQSSGSRPIVYKPFGPILQNVCIIIHKNRKFSVIKQ